MSSLNPLNRGAKLKEGESRGGGVHSEFSIPPSHLRHAFSSDLHPEDSQVHLFTFCQFHTPRSFPNLGPSFSFFLGTDSPMSQTIILAYISLPQSISPVDSNLHPLIYFTKSMCGV